MTAIVSLLIILTMSFLVTRLSTAALTLTGLSRDLARLQSVSAFTGVGFTTYESEKIVAHPVRRRILIILMVVGNAGVVTAVSSLILSFVGIESRQQGFERIAVLVAGLAVLWVVMLSKRVDQLLERVMQRLIRRWTDLEARDYASLLGLEEEYSVQVWKVDQDDWVEGRQLDELKLSKEGISVLGVRRKDGEYAGVPRGETRINAGDQLILYGRDEDIEELSERRKGQSGDRSHEEKVNEQEKVRRKQATSDEREE